MHKNKDFKIKFIFPYRFKNPNPYSYVPDYYLPYAMGVLSAFLRKHNYYVEQEDLSLRFKRHTSTFSPFSSKNMDLDIAINREEIYKLLKSGETGSELDLFIDNILNSTSIEGFDLIGFSIFTFLHFIFALVFSKRIKQITSTPIVFGGQFITLYGQLYPKVFDYADYMIVGDGSTSLLKLIDHLRNKITISEVPNLIYRGNGKLVINPRQNYPIEDMPIPDFTDLPLKLYKNNYFNVFGYDVILPYQISRGCTSRCGFCTFKYNDKLEFKSYNKVLSELSQMKERYRSKTFFFCDDVINNSYEYLEGLCGLFIKNKLDIHWIVFAKVGNLDKYILKKMKETGCRWLSFGIESGSDNILRRMNKGFTAEQASKTLKDVHESGLKTSICLIAGYPHETQEDIKQTIEFIRKNNIYIHHINIRRFVLICNSPIYYNPERYSVENLTPDFTSICFTFDECGGLKWEQKQEEQKDSERQIIKAIYKNTNLHRKCKDFLFSILRYLGLLLLKLKAILKLFIYKPYGF